MVLRRARSRGFTLIELLIVVAIIGLIASILIPNLLDALQKTRQKRTMSEMLIVGTSWMNWLTDQASSGAAGAAGQFDWTQMTPHSYSQMVSDLVPMYIQALPEVDGWKRPYAFGRGATLEAIVPIAIRSAGLDGAFDGSSYTSGPYEGTDYARDIVWAGGYFVRWPAGMSGN